MIVITHVEYGWDCVVAIADTIESAVKFLNDEPGEPFKDQFKLEDEGYVFHTRVRVIRDGKVK